MLYIFYMFDGNMSTFSTNGKTRYNNQGVKPRFFHGFPMLFPMIFPFFPRNLQWIQHQITSELSMIHLGTRLITYDLPMISHNYLGIRHYLQSFQAAMPLCFQSQQARIDRVPSPATQRQRSLEVRVGGKRPKLVSLGGTWCQNSYGNHYLNG